MKHFMVNYVINNVILIVKMGNVIEQDNVMIVKMVFMERIVVLDVLQVV